MTRATPAKPVHESDAHSSSWSFQQQQQRLQPAAPTVDSSLEQTAEQTSELFSSTLRSLSHDVRALGHLTTWKELLDDSPESNSDIPMDDDRREAFLESLCDLDDAVSSVEQKVSVLRQIVVEEQRALEQLNLLHKDSLEQNENLEYLVERCLQIKANNNNNTTSSSNKNTRALDEREAAPEQEQGSNHKRQHNPADTTGKGGSGSATNNRVSKSSFPGPGMSVSSNHSSSRYSMDSNSNSHAHTSTQGLTVHLDRVTQQELESVPRTTRGRTQVTVINDALEQFEKAFYKKATKERKQFLLLREAKQAALSHYHARSPEQVPDDDDLLHNMVVSEQELRQSCSFFTLGELNARTILAVLKTLKRIKQVPGTKGKFLYKLCL